MSIYFGATTISPTCSEVDIKFANYLTTLVDKDSGAVGGYCGWELGSFLNLNAARFKAKGSWNQLDESEGDESEDDDEDEDAKPPPIPPTKALKSTVKQVENPKKEGKATPLPPPVIQL